jgi:hypothetical protein
VRRLVVAADADALDPPAAWNGQQERRRLPVPVAAAAGVVRRRRPGEAPVGVRRRAAGPCSWIRRHRLFAARVREDSDRSTDLSEVVALRITEARTWTGKRRRHHGAIKEAVEIQLHQERRNTKKQRKGHEKERDVCGEQEKQEEGGGGQRALMAASPWHVTSKASPLAAAVRLPVPLWLPPCFRVRATVRHAVRATVAPRFKVQVFPAQRPTSACLVSDADGIPPGRRPQRFLCRAKPSHGIYAAGAPAHGRQLRHGAPDRRPCMHAPPAGRTPLISPSRACACAVCLSWDHGASMLCACLPA